MNQGNVYNVQRRGPRVKLIVVAVVIVVVVAALIAMAPYTVVPTGHIGIVTTFGHVENYTLPEGFHLKNPVQQVILMDTRTQKATLTLQAFSSDIQQVDVVCTVNYSVDKSTVQDLYQNIGVDYYEKVMEPRIQEDVKAVFTKYTAENLIGARATLANQIEELLQPFMEEKGIRIVSVAIENIDFTDAFTNAVEEKQVALQTKLKVETEQAQQVSVEKATAERRIISANAEAQERSIFAEADAKVARVQADASRYAGEQEAAKNQAIAQSLTDEFIQYLKITRWNGSVPQVQLAGGEAYPVINLAPEASQVPAATATPQP
jgi:regulator of protease activity HflC (stomatin/prohibitin superfamily)